MVKLDLKSLYRAHKKPILGGIALVLVAALGLGIWYYAANNTSEPVYVYPFQYIGMTEYWGDTQESNGPVSADNIQTVFLTETQTVTEIAVKEGDTVKKGDLLLSFDTTLDDLKVERKRLEVEKLKLQQQQARENLARINTMVPMEEVVFDDTSWDVEEDLGPVMGESWKILWDLDYDGSSELKPLMLWLSRDVRFGPGVISDLHEMAVQLQTENKRIELESTPPETDSSGEGEDILPEDPEPSESSDPSESSEPLSESKPETTGEGGSSGGSGSLEIPPVEVYSFYVVVRITEGNQQYASRTTWQGLKVYLDDNGIQFFNPKVSDPFMDDGAADTYEPPEIDMGSGYTAAQIAQMRAEEEKKIQDLDLKIKMADAEYKIMLSEVSDGNVYSEVDGVVVSLLTEEEAKSTRQSLIKVSGGGGFYVECFVNELEKDKLEPGMEVTVNDWNTGATYTGEVASKGDFPTQEGYFNGMGNPNSSYYPFRVFVDGEADLQAGSYVSVNYSTSEGAHGVYLENPFIRTEKGRSYVLILGQDGCLEQRFVVTGKSLWGSYTEITSGLTPEDLIAFPYGKNVKPGVKAVEGDMSNLYG